MLKDFNTDVTDIDKRRSKVHASYGRLLTRNELVLIVAVRMWFGAALRQIRSSLKGKYFKKDVASEFTDWNKMIKNGIEIVKPAAMAVFVSGGNMATKVLNISDGFDALTTDSIGQVDKMVAKLVREVSQETKEGIRLAIKQGIKEGKGMAKIARELRPLVGLTKIQTQSIINYKAILERKHPEMSTAMKDYKTKQYASKTQTRRLNMIARTETARAQNAGYIQSMKEMDVEKVEFSAVANACPICEGMDGNIYDVDKADVVIPVHPNCRCAMLPIV